MQNPRAREITEFHSWDGLRTIKLSEPRATCFSSPASFQNHTISLSALLPVHQTLAAYDEYPEAAAAAAVCPYTSSSCGHEQSLGQLLVQASNAQFLREHVI